MASRMRPTVPPLPSHPHRARGIYLRAAWRVTIVLLLLAVVPLPLKDRIEAVEAAPPPQVKVDPALEPLQRWLSHDDWSVRSMAAFELRKRSESGVVRLATALLAKETHPYAAAGALGALRGRPRRELVMEGGAQLVVTLLRLAHHEHPTVSAYAREVLRSVPPVKLGADLERYEGWWRRGEEAFVREQRTLLEEHARVSRTTAELMGEKGASSVAPEDKTRKFFERLETMRKHGLELCIVMDDTGSMRPVINAARAGAKQLIDRLRAYVPRFRAALVTYKDAAYFRIGLTQNSKKLTKAFDKMAASGGMDHEEGVDKGIYMAIRKTEIAWSRDAYRVVVVVGDAPPHDGDVARLLGFLHQQKDDVLYEHPAVVHTISTSDLPVLHFQRIARAGRGMHLTLEDAGGLVDSLVLVTFGGQDQERVSAWMEQIDALRKAERKKPTR